MKAGIVGITSALLASACCVGPIVLVLLGLGGSVFGAFFSEYHWHLQVGSLMVLALAWYRLLKEKKKCSATGCGVKGEQMTKYILGLVTLIVAVFIGMNFVGALPSSASDQANTVPHNAASITIPVEGMTCAMCELSVNSGLKKLPGVFAADTDSKAGQVTVQYDPLKVSIQHMGDVITKAGYTPVVKGPTP